MKIAFVFPGQGSQFVGMGKGWAEKYLEQAGEILGFDLKKVVLEGPEEELKKTEIQQPAIFAVSAAAYDRLKTKDSPKTVAGHSLGEYSALYAAEAISFEAGVKIVHLRGKFMQEAVPEGQGAMAAILGGEKEIIIDVCQEVGQVWPANFNSPGQIVISGKKSAVEAASEKLKKAGAKKIVPLAVSAPFHCPLMQPAADKLKVELDKFDIKDAQIPVVANVTANYVSKGTEIKELLIKQITSPVLWEDSVKKMVNDGITHFVEVGPGKVLCGLIKKIAPEVEAKTFEDM
jgi:[acyl-carrier-protein] S-malonyltransferase